MRKLFSGLAVAIGLCGVCLAQGNNAGGQQGAAGQIQPGQLNQAQNLQGQAGQQLRAGQAQPGQVQPGQVQPGQPGQQNQFGQPGQSGQAAQRGQFGQQFVPGQPGQLGQTETSDQQIAACVYGACHHEIEIAKFAESKAQSEEVRQFAQQMVREHTPGCQAMQRRAGELASDTPNQPQAGGGLNWISVHKEIGQQCLASLKQELSAKQGIQFDQCFMGEQIGEHLKVISSLKVLRNHASAELRQELDKELQVAQQHLQQAKQIADQLQERTSERVSRRPDGTKQ